MNFLQLVQQTRILAGTQGTGPSTVVGVGGYEEALVKFVQDAWTDIQNYREEWNFLKSTVVFNTVIGQDTYDKLAIFLTATPEFKKFEDNSFVIDTGSSSAYLNQLHISDLERRYLNETAQDQPSVFAIDTNEDIVLKSIPDAIYTITAKYWRSPQVLSLDADIPLMNPSYHQLIVYEALKKMAVYLSSPEIFQNYEKEAKKMMGQLMRQSNPAKKIKISRVFA